MKTAIITLCLGTVALAQGVPGDPAPFTMPTQFPGVPGGPVATFRFVEAEALLEGTAVTGAPYSADAVTDTRRLLADGNEISTTSSSSFYRDSAGRTRREMVLKMIGPLASADAAHTLIMINDPVAKVSYKLDPMTHQAHKIPAMISTEAGTSMIGTSIVSKRRVVKRVGTGAGSIRIEVMDSQPEGNADIISESLGTQMIEGVAAEGTRTTRTIPEGQIGNARAIHIVNETWYSPELQTTVLMKTTNPLEGDTTFRLTNIQRADPAGSLFEVPADYTVAADEKGDMVYRTIKKP